ncbi:MAG: serine/threonine protein kinase, partial [Pantoea agglomerans]
LLGLAAVAILAVIVTVWLTNRHSATPEGVSNRSAVTNAPASAPSAAAVPAALATVYLKLESGESVVLNGQPVEVKPGSSGFAALNLAAGQYKIDVKNGSEMHSQSLTIDKPGTWLINPGN